MTHGNIVNIYIPVKNADKSKSGGGIGKNVVIFGADMSSSMHIDNKGKNILIFGKGPTQGLDNTTLAAEKNCSIRFTENGKKLSLSLHYNGANSYLFVNAVEIIGDVSKDFSFDNMKKTGFYGYVYDFSVDYDATAVDDILDMQKYLIKKHIIK